MECNRINRPCGWSVDLIREDARMKAEEDAKYGPTEVVGGQLFYRRTISGVVD